MGFYPLLIDLQGLPCLVAGGGALAKHKVELLVGQGADVTVVAPEISPEIRALPVAAAERRVRAEDAAGKALVVDATGDADAERLLREACRRMHIPFNSACRGEACTAIFPAVYTSGRTVVAVSSRGASPAASAWLRDTLAAHVPARMDEILAQMEQLRSVSRALSPDQRRRRRFLRRCLDRMLALGRPLSADELEEEKRRTEEENA